MWFHLDEAKDAFPDIRMMVKLKKMLSEFCARRVPILLHPSLYRAVKLTYPMDVGGIVLDGRMTSEIGTGSLGQSVGVLIAADFRPVCE